jgi:hypothetical protein
MSAVNSRTIDKVRYIASLLGPGFTYKNARCGGYTFTYRNVSHKLTKNVLWKDTPDECAKLVKDNVLRQFKADFFGKHDISNLKGYEYIFAHRQRNEDYIRYLQGVG